MQQGRRGEEAAELREDTDRVRVPGEAPGQVQAAFHRRGRPGNYRLHVLALPRAHEDAHEPRHTAARHRAQVFYCVK